MYDTKEFITEDYSEQEFDDLNDLLQYYFPNFYEISGTFNTWDGEFEITTENEDFIEVDFNYDETEDDSDQLIEITINGDDYSVHENINDFIDGIPEIIAKVYDGYLDEI